MVVSIVPPLTINEGKFVKAKKALNHQRRQSNPPTTLTHGYARGPSKSKIYIVWQNMKRRCLNKLRSDYSDYGGRGIKICNRWINSFENFLADMGNVPSPKHSLDRIDVNGDYSPENCRWATQKEQQNNRRSNVFIEYNGMRKTLAQWAEFIGMTKQTLHQRVSDGWDFGTAITKPIQKHCRKSAS